VTNATLRQLVDISRALGRDPDLVQGGGGNTSAKTPEGEYMYIKASGAALKQMSLRQGWCKLALAPVAAILRDRAVGRLECFEREAVVAKRLAAGRIGPAKPGTSPSAESYFHAILGTYTIHLHPLVVGPYVCSKHGRAAVERLFESWREPILWVPYAPTGYMLGRKLTELARRHERVHQRPPKVIFLQKHGLIVSEDTAATALQTVHAVVDKCAAALPTREVTAPKPLPRASIARARQAIKRTMVKKTGLHNRVEFYRDNGIVDFLGRADAKALCRCRPLVPQEIAYAGGSPMWVEQCDDEAILEALREYETENGSVPAGFLVKDMGLFVVGSRETIAATRDTVKVSLLTRAWTTEFGGPDPLTRSQQRFVTTMYPFRFKT
jgi:rhamnose utilization protein RhaD (predicted bifunctional aldolase and dehydrogenase)